MKHLELVFEKAQHSPLLEALIPARHDVCEQLGLYVTEADSFMRQDQQHVRPFAQRQLDNGAPPQLQSTKTKRNTDECSH